ESEAAIVIGSNEVRIVQETNYPFEGKVRLRISPSQKSSFPLFLRIPDWAHSSIIKVNGNVINDDVKQGTYLRIERKWKKEDVVDIQFPFNIRVVKKEDK